MEHSDLKNFDAIPKMKDGGQLFHIIPSLPINRNKKPSNQLLTR